MIEQIDRLDDPRLSSYAHVGDHAWLRERGLFVAEGRLIVQRLLEAGAPDIESILLTATALAPLRDRLPHGIPVYVAEPPVIEGLTGFDFHRGCLALARRPEPLDLNAFVSARRLIALEGIANPDNVGGLFRVALGLGAEGVLLDPATADPLYRKAIRTSMGASLSVPFARVQPWPSGLEAFRGFRVLALTPAEDAAPIDALSFRPDEQLMFILGSEGEGLSDQAMRYADMKVRIPIDSRASSLNVVVAAGIALHAFNRGRKAEG